MKKTLLSLLIATTAVIATAQTPATQKTKEKSKTSFSIYGGPSLNKLVGKSYPNGEKLDNTFNTGFHVGVNVEIPLSPVLYIQPGLQYIGKGTKKKTSTYTTTELIYYAEVPVHIVFKPTLGRGHGIIGIGGNVGYGVTGSWRYDEVQGSQFDDRGKVKFKNSWSANDPNPDNDDYIRPLDVSASIILGYQLPMNLYIQFKGQYSILNTSPTLENAPSGFVQANTKNVNVGLSVGYRF